MKRSVGEAPRRPSLAVIVVSWNCADVLDACIESLLAQQYAASVQIVVWDNGSEDRSIEVAGAYAPRVLALSEGRNLGFARANNESVRATNSEVVAFLNPDTWLPTETTLDRWVRTLEDDPGIGICVPRLLNPDGTLQRSVGTFSSPVQTMITAVGLHRLVPKSRRPRWAPSIWNAANSAEIQWAKGAAMVMYRRHFDAIGGWPETTFMYAEDQAICWNTRKAGAGVWYSADTEVVHIDDHSAGKRWNPDEKSRVAAEAEVAFIFGSQSRIGARATVAGLKCALWLRMNLFLGLGKTERARQCRSGLEGVRRASRMHGK